LILLVISRIVILIINLIFPPWENTIHFVTNPIMGGILAKFKITIKYVHFSILNVMRLFMLLIFDWYIMSKVITTPVQ